MIANVANADQVISDSFDRFRTIKSAVSLDINKIDDATKRRQEMIDNYYDILKADLEDLEIPDRFSIDEILELVKTENMKNPEEIDDIERNMELKINLTKSKFFVEQALKYRASPEKLADFLYEYFYYLKTFYEDVLEKINQALIKFSINFFYTEFNFEHYNLLDLSIQNEEIATLALMSLIEKTKAKLARYLGMDPSKIKVKIEKHFFERAVRRIGIARLKGIIEAYISNVDKIFEKVGNMELNRQKLRLLLIIWNAKNKEDIIKIKNLDLENISYELYLKYFEKFKNSFHRCREFLLDNYFEIFEMENQLKEKDLVKTLNNAINTIIID